MMTLVMGGAASGKSAYAEALICGAGELRRVYLATMQPFGKEAEERIRKHREMRADKGFETRECFTVRAVLKLSASLPPGAAVLLEDLGNLCANEMFSGNPEGRTAAAVITAVTALREQCSELVIVANEVFSGGAEYAGETLSYLRLLGQVSIALAAMADRVVEVQCGIPVMLKDMDSGPEPEAGAETGAETGTRSGAESDIKAGAGEKRSGMIFVTGPMFSGKRKAAAELLGIPVEEIRVFENTERNIRGKHSRGIAGVQSLAAGCRDENELLQLAEKLSEYEVVISTETGCGVVPVDPAEREAREKAGRLNCLLAARAETVIRVFCGIPQVICGKPL